MINQDLKDSPEDLPILSSQNSQQEELRKKSIDELKDQISIINQENSRLAETIHNLEKELELKRSKVTLQMSKLKEDKQLSTYLTFFFFVILSFYFVFFSKGAKK